MLASQEGHDEVVTTLLNCGANPDIQREVCVCVGGCNGGGWGCKMFMYMYINISVLAMKFVGQTFKLEACYIYFTGSFLGLIQPLTSFTVVQIRACT